MPAAWPAQSRPPQGRRDDMSEMFHLDDTLKLSVHPIAI
jgi:hypothetical protein